MLLPLSNTDKKAIIDDKNYDRVRKFKWFLKRVGSDAYYVAASIRQNGKVKTIYLHRFIIQPKEGMDVHHKNTNTLDNQEENIEEKEAPVHRTWHLKKRLLKS